MFKKAVMFVVHHLKHDRPGRNGTWRILDTRCWLRAAAAALLVVAHGAPTVQWPSQAACQCLQCPAQHLGHSSLDGSYLISMATVLSS